MSSSKSFFAEEEEEGTETEEGVDREGPEGGFGLLSNESRLKRSSSLAGGLEMASLVEVEEAEGVFFFKEREEMESEDDEDDIEEREEAEGVEEEEEERREGAEDLERIEELEEEEEETVVGVEAFGLEEKESIEANFLFSSSSSSSGLSSPNKSSSLPKGFESEVGFLLLLLLVFAEEGLELLPPRFHESQSPNSLLLLLLLLWLLLLLLSELDLSFIDPLISHLSEEERD
jgi:hypothetical protein